MAIATDITVNIEINMQTVDTFGLSKTLDNYTTEELKEALYCAMYNPARRNNVLRTTEYGWVGAFDKDNGVFQWPFKIQPSGSTYIWDSGASSEGYNTPEGLYCGVIWLRREFSVPESVITVDNISEYRMVTEWNVNKFVFNVPSLNNTAYSEVASADWTQKTYPCCYVPEGWGTMVYHTNRGEADDETANVSVYPYSLFIYEDKLFLHAIKIEAGFIYNSTQEVYTKIFGDTAHWDIDKTTTIATSYNNNYLSVAQSGGGYGKNYSLSGYPGNNRFPVAWSGPGGYTIWTQIGCDDEQRYLTLWDHSGYANIGGYIRIHSYFSKVDDVLLYFANMGVYFYTDQLYKPIITDGIVTGYTLDTTTQSDIDNWDGDSMHNVPITPPVPPVPPGDDEDNDDPLSSVGAPFGTGLAHYYISTVDGAALNQISEAMSTWDIDGTKKDLYRNLISCKIVKPPTAVPATPGVFVIYGEKPQYQGADITINEVTGNPDISFGPYSIDRKFNDFRDRAPFTRAEIFLPYCGWCVLPSHVIGRSVSVSYYSDIIAGTVKAVVYCGTNPVAEASGVMSVDIPFAAENVGEKVAAANIGMLAYGRAAIQTAAGIGTAVASKGKSGWGNILSGGTAVMSAYNQLAQVENGNYTEICGKSGDGCALAGVDTIVIKITRPKYSGNNIAPFVPAGFAHTVGFVSMKQSKVNACTGLIVCDNVEVSGISGATDTERAEIKRVLESGLYVNSPPE